MLATVNQCLGRERVREAACSVSRLTQPSFKGSRERELLAKAEELQADNDAIINAADDADAASRFPADARPARDTTTARLCVCDCIECTCIIPASACTSSPYLPSPSELQQELLRLASDSRESPRVTGEREKDDQQVREST